MRSIIFVPMALSEKTGVNEKKQKFPPRFSRPPPLRRFTRVSHVEKRTKPREEGGKKRSGCRTTEGVRRPGGGFPFLKGRIRRGAEEPTVKK